MNLNKELITNRPLRWMLRLLLWSPLLLPLLLEAGEAVIPMGRLLGHFAGQRDAARGHYELRSSGLPPGWWRRMRGVSWESRRAWNQHYAALLREKYGIGGVPSGFWGPCVRFQFEIDYGSAYSKAQQAAIAKNFGRDALLQCAEKAYTDLNLKPSPPLEDDPWADQHP